MTKTLEKLSVGGDFFSDDLDLLLVSVDEGVPERRL